MVKPSGALCSKMARKISQPSQPETRNPEPMATAVKERMKAQSGQHRVARMHADKLVLMRLFAKVEVRVDGVFQQVHHAIAGHDEARAQQRIPAIQL